MSSFSIPHLFVVPASNSIPTSGSSSALTAGQFGIFRDDYTAATAANIASSAPKYIYIFQGNHVTVPGMANKRSDKIYADNILEWYKIPALTSSSVQITTVTGLAAVAGEPLNLTIRLFGNYIENAFFNGLTRTVTVPAECLECGADPCVSTVTDETYEALADAVNAEELLSQYITASVTGSVDTDDATLVLTANALTNPITATSDVHNDPYRVDRIFFYTYLNKGASVSQDFLVDDVCDIPGTITVTQRATYKHGMAAEIKLMEIWYYSYSSVYRELFTDPAYNGAFSSQVTAASYDLYYIKFKMPQPDAFHSIERMDETVIIAVPTGEATTIEAILVAFAGAVKNSQATADVTFSPLVP